MSERTSNQRALAPLHASEDTLEEVLDMIAEKETRRYTARRGLRTALIAAALALALSVTAYAIGEYTGFFETVFGNEDIQSRQGEHVVYTDGDGNVVSEYDLPGRERVPADPDAAQTLVGGGTGSVGASVTAAGVTFTVEDFVIDANGLGALTYTMEDPKGFPGVEFDGGDIRSDPLAGGSLLEPRLTVYDGSGEKIAWMDSAQFAAAGGTDTRKTVALYFAPVGSMAGAEQLELTFSVATGYDAARSEVHIQEDSVVFPLAGAVQARTLTGPEGWTASLSPVGLVIAPPAGTPLGDDPFDDVTLYMADGTAVTVKQTEPYMDNATVEIIGEADAMVFDRLVDPAQVESIAVAGGNSPAMTFTK